MDAEVLAVGEDLAAELLPGTASFPSLTVMPDPGRIAAGRQPPQRLDGTLAGGLAALAGRLDDEAAVVGPHSPPPEASLGIFAGLQR